MVTLVGRLTKDPVLRYTPNGVPVASFTLAVNRTFTNQSGERETDYINCVVWRTPAENVANFLKKGSLAGVDGSIQTRTYEGQDGKLVYVTEVIARYVQFLDSKKNNQSQEQRRPESNNTPSGRNSNNNPYADPYFEGEPISDDDLPF